MTNTKNVSVRRKSPIILVPVLAELAVCLVAYNLGNIAMTLFYAVLFAVSCCIALAPKIKKRGVILIFSAVTAVILFEFFLNRATAYFAVLDYKTIADCLLLR